MKYFPVLGCPSILLLSKFGLEQAMNHHAQRGSLARKGLLHHQAYSKGNQYLALHPWFAFPGLAPGWTLQSDPEAQRTWTSWANIEENLFSSMPTKAAVRVGPSGRTGHWGGVVDAMIHDRYQRRGHWWSPLGRCRRRCRRCGCRRCRRRCGRHSSIIGCPPLYISGTTSLLGQTLTNKHADWKG